MGGFYYSFHPSSILFALWSGLYHYICLPLLDELLLLVGADDLVEELLVELDLVEELDLVGEADLVDELFRGV